MITSRILVAALLSGFAAALPHRIRDSSINEPAVSAPNGTPITEGSQPIETPSDNGSSGSYGSSGSSMDSSSYGSSMDSGSYGSSMDSGSYGSSMDSGSYGSYGSSMDSGSYSVAMTDSTSTMMSDSTSTTVAWNSYQTPTYGSGSSNWGSYNQGSNYNDCVSQCLAQYGSPPQSWSPPPSQTQPPPESGTSSGSGVIHTVIVAPAQGVLRYVPFALNASVGDTVRFMWGANNHTVTKGSELTPCNASSDSPFTSGVQLKGNVFDQIINDTNPLFVHCGVPGHCQKGMFGVINPPNAAGASTSVSLMMSNWTSSNPDIAAYSAIVSNMTQNNLAAGLWGGNIDTSGMPGWAQPMLAENIMYTRSFLASNPNVMKQDGSVDLSGSQSLMFPEDVSAALNDANTDAGAGTSSSSGAPSTSASASATTGSSAAATTSNASNSAASASPKVVVALVAAAASFFLL